jgi:hypothetical protein
MSSEPLGISQEGIDPQEVKIARNTEPEGNFIFKSSGSLAAY